MSRKRHGHHGGAWKVAYADFVTAMMALFLVLWLASQDQKIKEAVARSFKNPFISVTKESTGIVPNKDVQAVKSTDANFDSASAIELSMLRKLSQDVLKMLQSNNENYDDTPGKLEFIPDGVRISIFDRARRPIFEADSDKLTEYGNWVFTTLAWQVSRFTNSFVVELEGHTEQGYQPRGETYTSWELSTDRANTARRKLTEHGVTLSQIRKVAGFADTQPMADRPKQDDANRRVAVLLKIKGDPKEANG